MNCVKPIDIVKVSKENVKKKLLVPCGKCINCKTSRAATWTNRLVDEAMSHNHISVIVLTYDNEHVRYGIKTKKGRYASLYYRDVQMYLKRLRKGLNKLYAKEGGKAIKYYCAGEYGEKTKRPHYHVILFGVNGFKNKREKEIIDHSWKLGNVLWDKKRRPVDRKALAYCAQYVQKKMYDEEENYYLARGIMPPQNYMSKGIGKEFAIKNKKKFIEQNLAYSNKEEGTASKTNQMPRYYLKLYRKEEIMHKVAKGSWMKDSIDMVLVKVVAEGYKEKIKKLREIGLKVEPNGSRPNGAVRTWQSKEWKEWHMWESTPEMREYELKEAKKQARKRMIAIKEKRLTI